MQKLGGGHKITQIFRFLGYISGKMGKILEILDGRSPPPLPMLCRPCWVSIKQILWQKDSQMNNLDSKNRYLELQIILLQTKHNFYLLNHIAFKIGIHHYRPSFLK